MNSQILKKVAEIVGTPFFIYDGQVLGKNISRFFNAAKERSLSERIFVFISYFTTSNPQIFRKVVGDKVGVLLQTEEEYHQLKKFDVNARMIASPSFLSDQEIDSWSSKNISVNLASLEEVRYWIKKYGSPMSFRLDLTFRQNQRTGIKKRQINELVEALNQAKITPKSIHVYCGTGNDIGKVKKYLKKTIKIWHRFFPDVKEINLGGGFGFDYAEMDNERKHFDWNSYFLILIRSSKNIVFRPM